MPRDTETQGHNLWSVLHVSFVVAKLAVLAFAIALSAAPPRTSAQSIGPVVQAGFSLQSIHQRIEADYATVKHIQATNLEVLLHAGDNVVLFDVREIEEYVVSRLDGAERIDPDIETDAFIERFGGALQGKLVVFYCSVGVRSSELAERVQDALRQTGAYAVYNLEGGIFNWHNEFRHLVTDSGKTSYVHPYSDHWSQLLKRRDLVRYEQA